jgi:transcriptional repressor NrdR
VEQPDLVVTKHDGRTESFNPEKLRKGIALAIAKRPVTGDQVDRTVEEIEAELRSAKRREVPAGLIGALVMEKLKALDHVAYIRFASVYRDFTSASSFQDEVKELLRSHREARGDKVEHS